MKTKYKQYKEYIKRIEHLQKLKAEGVYFIHKRNYIKLVSGLICLGVAIFPNGLGFIFYPLGFMLLGINKIDLIYYKDKVLRRYRK